MELFIERRVKKMKKIIIISSIVLVLALVGWGVYAFLTKDQTVYDLAVEEGYDGTMAEWLETITGDSEKTAFELYRDAVGYDGIEFMWRMDLRKNDLVTYVVTFDVDGGALAEGVATEAKSLAGCYVTLPIPTKEGYNFKGWKINDTLYNSETSPAVPVLEDVTAKAEWEIKIFSVQFVDQNDKLLKEEKVPYGGAATAPDAPTVEHYTFSAWDADFSVITADMTAKAVYAPLLYTVTFDVDGGELPEGFAATAKPQSGTKFELPVPTKYGHEFIGWQRVDIETNAVLGKTVTIASDLSLKAVWKQNLFMVTFLDINGNVLKTEEVARGHAATAPDAPEVERFRFRNWDTDYTVVAEDLTVTAVYAPIYVISYETGDGSAVADTEFCGDELPVAPDAPTKRFYAFEGWFRDKDHTIPFDFSSPLVEDITLYAYFVADYCPIYTAEELVAIGDDNEGKYYLANNISLSGMQWIPLKGFKGVFDGNGYKITDFTISADGDAGFFVSNSGTIQNLTLADFTMYVSTQETNTSFVAGALVGTNEGRIDNCHVRDAILSYYFYRNTYSGIHRSYVGGLVGVNSGIVSNCSVNASVNAIADVYAHGPGGRGSYSGGIHLYLGGVTGDNQGEITFTSSNVLVSGSAIITSVSGYYISWNSQYYYDTMYTGVLLSVGGNSSLNSGIISHCESNIEFACSAAESKPVLGVTNAMVQFGGFVSENSGTISKCQATSSMKTDYNDWWSISAGGFVAVNKMEITSCHSTTSIETKGARSDTVTDISIGGFVAFNQGTITFSYTTYEIDTHVLTTVGGFVGRNEKSATIMKCIADGNIIYTGEPLGVGSFIGVKDDGSTLFKNYYSAESTILQGETDVTAADSQATAQDRATMQTSAFLIDTLGYNTEVWEIVDGEYPTLIESK